MIENRRAVQQLTDFTGAGIIYGRRFNGSTDALLERVPQCPGIYAFFKDIELNTEDPTVFFEGLTREMRSKKFVDREGSINPLYHVTLRSKTDIPKSKLDQIKSLSEDSSFRKSVTQALKLSLIFQSPLYVGKAIDLRSRLRQHYDPTSPLSQRLSTAGTSLYTTTVVLLPILDDTQSSDLNSDDLEDESDNAQQLDEDQSLIYEEIFSRIFSPLFTIRYG